MQKYIARATASLFMRGRSQFATVSIIKGSPEEVDDKNVRLRGIHIKSETHDAPTMIFFPEILDRVENWVSFFVNPLHRVPDSVIVAHPAA